MNFDSMWTVHHGHSDVIFWEIAIPVMCVVIPIFLWNDFNRMVHYLKKRFIQRTVKKEVKMVRLCQTMFTEYKRLMRFGSFSSDRFSRSGKCAL